VPSVLVQPGDVAAAPGELIEPVMAQLPNFHRLLKKHDVDVELHTAGEFKRTLTMFGENTEKGRRKFLEELEDTHVLFKQFVAEHRPQLNIELFHGHSFFTSMLSSENDPKSLLSVHLPTVSSSAQTRCAMNVQPHQAVTRSRRLTRAAPTVGYRCVVSTERPKYEAALVQWSKQ